MNRTDIDILVGGVSVLGNLADRLLSLTVVDEPGVATDSASFSLDNAGGVIALPRTGVPILIRIAGVPVFGGVVDKIRSDIGAGSGRVLLVSAKGADMTGPAKEPQSLTFPPGATILEILRLAGAAAGVVDITVDDALAGLTREREIMDAESFLAFGERLAGEIGGVFKVRETAAIMARRGAGRSPSGKPLPTVVARYGENLISGSIEPFAARRRYSRVVVRYYDLEAGAWQSIERETGVEGAAASSTARFTAPDKPAAEQMAEAKVAEARDGGGDGGVVIDGTPLAMPEGTLIVLGWGPAEDGTYRIGGVTHTINRGQGYLTSAKIKRPGEPAETPDEEEI